MKKVVKLTESDLTRIVKRVINEGIMIGCDPNKFSTPQNVTAKLEGGLVILTFQNGERCSLKPDEVYK